MVSKTYKREASVVLFLVFLGLSACFLYSGDNNFWIVAQSLLPYTMVFAGGAFGLDAYAKQISK